VGDGLGEGVADGLADGVGLGVPHPAIVTASVEVLLPPTAESPRAETVAVLLTEHGAFWATATVRVKAVVPPGLISGCAVHVTV
jgi:hypothetical protein